MTSRRRPATDRRPPRRHTSLAREHGASYRGEAIDTGKGPDPTDDPDLADDPGLDDEESGGPGRAPLGLPVLGELPELAGALTALADADRMIVTGVLALSRLLGHDQDPVVDPTGVGLEHWIAITGAAPRLERRTWLRTARLLRRLPRLCEQVEAGRVSAGQLRGLTIALRGCPTVIDGELDGWLSDAAERLHDLGAEPDVLIDQARQAVVELTDQLDQVEAEANQDRFLHLQPKLDGTGGTFTGSEDAYGFAVLEQVTRLRPGQPQAAADRARADNLQTALHGIPPCSHDPDAVAPAVVDELEPGPVPGGLVGARAHDAAWADAYEQQLAEAPGLAERIAGYAFSGGLAPPKLLVRAELDTLAGGHLPADVLAQLAGGKLRLTSQAARRLIDAHGAELRLIVIDDGEVVGVGRSTRRPSGWLTDVQMAIHDTCTGPLCHRPAIGADIDHAVAWHPDGDQPCGGRTDGDNLGPLCLGTNRNRGATGWRPHQHGGSGIRTWTHQRTGLTTTSIPATWRPPNRRPPPIAAHAPDHAGGDGDPTSDDDLPF